MPLLNLSKAEQIALGRALTHAPPTAPLESVRRKLRRLDREPEPIAGQMNVYDCIEEASR